MSFPCPDVGVNRHQCLFPCAILCLTRLFIYLIISSFFYYSTTTEAAERFAYFGFRAILVLYFTWELHYTEDRAIALFAYVTCGAYLSPLLGAWLADGPWGRFTTIWRFGVLYVMGLALLAASAWKESEDTASLTAQRGWTFGGLFFVCLGTGGIKPCVSAFGADQVALRHANHAPVPTSDDSENVTAYRDVKDSTDGKLVAHSNKCDEGTSEEFSDELVNSHKPSPEAEHVQKFFNYFYFCINVGAVLSFVVVPFTRVNYGFGPAFSLSFGFMSIALALFLWKRNEYIHHVPGSSEGASLSTNFILCGWLLRHGAWHYTWVRKFLPFIRPCDTPPIKIKGHVVSNDGDADAREEEELLKQQLSDAAQAVHVLPILAIFPIFWCLYDQQGSVWTLQATRMRLDWHMTPENMLAVNPLEIVLFIPLFTQFLYPKLESWGLDISPLRRMAWGMVLTAIAFSVSGMVESAIEFRAKNDMEPISVLWQLPQITILSIAEIFISVTGLEFAYATSPHRLKAFLMALFLLTTAVGDFLGGILYSTAFVGVDRALVMHICAMLMFANRFVFYFVARWWERRDAHALSRHLISKSWQQRSIELEERKADDSDGEIKGDSLTTGSLRHGARRQNVPMPSRLLLLVSLTLLGASSLPTAVAWGKVGHEIVGNLAWRLLPETVQEQVLDILPNSTQYEDLTPLGAVADWADVVRHTHEYSWSGGLHFIDVHDEVLPDSCFTTDSAACAFVWTRDCVQDWCVVGALRNYTHRLTLAEPSGATAEALKFVVHFVGDVHQPLHVSRASDRGGNSIAVHTNFTNHSVKPSSHHLRGGLSATAHHGMNLHAVWDDVILETYQKEECGNKWTQLQEHVYQWIQHNDTNDWTRCADGGRHVCLDVWAQESWLLAQRDAYVHVNNGSQIADQDTLPRVYYEHNLPIVLEQLAKASVRLAWTLIGYMYGNDLGSYSDADVALKKAL